MQEIIKKNKVHRFMSVFLAIVMIVGLIPIVSIQNAYAASGEMYLDSPDTPIPYGGYNTTYMFYNGAPVFCGQPAKDTPASGTYTMETIDPQAGAAGNIHTFDEICANLWFGFGGYGYDRSMYPDTWYDGSELTDANIWAITHIILSDTFGNDTESALHGCSEEFYEWCNTYILASPNDAGTHLQYQMYLRRGEVPQWFKDLCYMIRTGEGTQICLGFIPAGDMVGQKVSSNPSLSDNNNCYSLAGAVYTIYSDSNCTNQVATMTTGEDGKMRSEYLAPATYYVKETTTAKGYALDSTVYSVEVKARETAQINGGTVSDTPQNDPIRLLLGKYDGQKVYTENDPNLPQGSATLAGAQFTISYYDGQYSTAQDAQNSGAPKRSWVYETNDEGIINPQEQDPISGDEVYTNTAGETAYPLGTLLIQETKAPQGYNLNSDIVVRNITSDTDQIPQIETYNTPAIPNTVKRGDLKFTKVQGQDMSRIANAAFLVTSDTTQESHVIVTDENGEVRTESAWNPHTQNTNANDNALIKQDDGTYTVDETKLDATAGVWFCNTEQTTEIKPDDSMGALPYDTYTIEELSTSVNDGLAKVKFSVNINRDSVVVDAGTIDDNPYNLNTTLSTSDGEKELTSTTKDVELVDTVAYSGFKAGQEYTLTGTLHIAQTSEDGTIIDLGELTDAEGNVVTSTKTFTPKYTEGLVDVTFEIEDLSALENKSLVAFEVCTQEDTIIASHEDIEAKGQTIKIVSPTQPQIKTSAKDKSDNDKNISQGKVTVIDTVYYEGLTPNKTYTLVGTMMDKRTGEPLLDKDNNPISTTTEFVPFTATGTTDVEFTFDTSSLDADTELVVFEKCLDADGTLIATHEDIDDEGQTVKVESPTTPTTTTSESMPKTGDSIPWYVFVLLACALATITTALYINKKKQCGLSSISDQNGGDDEPTVSLDKD